MVHDVVDVSANLKNVYDLMDPVALENMIKEVCTVILLNSLKSLFRPLLNGDNF